MAIVETAPSPPGVRFGVVASIVNVTVPDAVALRAATWLRPGGSPPRNQPWSIQR